MIEPSTPAYVLCESWGPAFSAALSQTVDVLEVLDVEEVDGRERTNVDDVDVLLCFASCFAACALLATKGRRILRRPCRV